MGMRLYTGNLPGAIALKKMESPFSLLAALHLSKTPHLGVGPCGPLPYSWWRADWLDLGQVFEVLSSSCEFMMQWPCHVLCYLLKV